jgi:hypothetical protein
MCWVFPDHPHRPALIRLLPLVTLLVLALHLTNLVLASFDKRSEEDS